MFHKQLYRHQSWGEIGEIDLEITVKTSKELGDTKDANISGLGNRIHEEVMKMLLKDDKRKEANNKLILDCFGEHLGHYKETTNKYAGIYVNDPWFLVYTKIGMIEIGWRTHVISIDWTDTGVKQTAEELFPDENVTKEGKLIHAYGFEKAKLYIQKLFNSYKPN